MAEFMAFLASDRIKVMVRTRWSSVISIMLPPY